MKKKLLLFMVLCSGMLLSFSRTFADNTIQSEATGEVLIQGMLGTQSSYSIEAKNFVIHIKDVPKMDILTLSDAKLMSNGSETSGALQVLDNSVKAKAGVYGAVIVLEENQSVQATITIFVVDDSSVYDDHKIIYGQDFQVKHSEKRDLTELKAKKLAMIRAFDIQSGQEETDKVTVNNGQLESYIQSNKNKPFPLDWSLESKNDTIITKRIYASASSEKVVGDNNNKGTLPNLGVKNSVTLVAFGLILIFGVIYIINFMKRRNDGNKNSNR